MNGSIGWVGIVRLGLVQMALGGVVALATSTLNRVMVVELALPATLPGLLFGIHYAAEMLRPRWGFGSDRGGRRTPWIAGGMAVLAASGLAAAASIALMQVHTAAGIACAIAAYAGIGVGAGAAGTSLLVLLATLAAPARKPAAAALVWTMMIAGTAVSARGAGAMLEPFSMSRLVLVSAIVSAVAFTLAILAIWGVEPARNGKAITDNSAQDRPRFVDAIKDVWAEPAARRLTIFIFMSMLAFSAQELLLEPFAGSVFGLVPGETAKLFGSHRAGIVLGMLLGALAGSLTSKGKAGRTGTLWVAGGCFASSVGLVALASVGLSGLGAFLKPVVFALGVANGAYAVAAIGTMITMANKGKGAREGVRMGLWGAAQAVAFGAGGVAGTAAVDITRYLTGSPTSAYSLLFVVQGMLFLISAALALRLTAGEGSLARSEPQDTFHSSAVRVAGQAGAR